MDFISIIRFFATILITNSHFGVLYPSGYSSLGTGGMIGNALFFFCSGYTLYLSLNKTKMYGIQWLFKRLIRIYPSVWLFRVFSWLFLGGTISWINIIVPGYWFLNAIIIFYIVFYFIIKYCSHHIFLIICILGIILVCYISVFYVQHYRCPEFIMEDTSNYYRFHWFYLFTIMLFGAYLAKRGDKTRFNEFDYIKLLIAIVLYYGYKGILIKYELWTPQLLLPLFLLLVMYYFYKSSNYTIHANVIKKKSIQSFVFYISNLTLDIYIVQFVCIDFSKGNSFPIGYLEAILLILVSAIFLNYLSKNVVSFTYTKLKFINK